MSSITARREAGSSSGCETVEPGTGVNRTFGFGPASFPHQGSLIAVLPGSTPPVRGAHRRYEAQLTDAALFRRLCSFQKIRCSRDRSPHRVCSHKDRQPIVLHSAALKDEPV